MQLVIVIELDIVGYMVLHEDMSISLWVGGDSDCDSRACYWWTFVLYNSICYDTMLPSHKADNSPIDEC